MTLAFAAAAMLATALLAAAVAPAAAGLDAFRWKARPVLVFAPSTQNPDAAEQLRRLAAERASLDDREMPVLVVTSRSVTTLAGSSGPSGVSAGALRKAYGVAEGAFAIILVGKDGGEKFRSTTPVGAGRLVGLVDAMPMRRNEAR